MTRPLLPQDQPTITALGLRIRQARERRGIGAELFAERLGLTLETVHSLEAGDASIDIATLYRAMRILQLAGDFDLLAADGVMQRKLVSIAQQGQ